MENNTQLERIPEINKTLEKLSKELSKEEKEFCDLYIENFDKSFPSFYDAVQEIFPEELEPKKLSIKYIENINVHRYINLKFELQSIFYINETKIKMIAYEILDQLKQTSKPVIDSQGQFTGRVNRDLKVASDLIKILLDKDENTQNLNITQLPTVNINETDLKNTIDNFKNNY
jgi:hypothetical protein